MYKLFDDAAEKHIIKKTVYDKDNTEKIKFIPDYIRKLFRKKFKWSKKIGLRNYQMNHKILEELEQRDYKLCNEYKKQRIVQENRALDKIKEVPSYFYKYSQEFCKSKHVIPSLKKDDVLYNVTKSKTKILSD